jgi:hypothetical protein
MRGGFHDSTFHTSFEYLGAQILDPNLKLYMWLLDSGHKDEEFSGSL